MKAENAAARPQRPATVKTRKPRGRKKTRKVIPIPGTQEVFVHCAYNCGRSYRAKKCGLDKKEWHKTLRKLNAHEAQRCPHRHSARSSKITPKMSEVGDFAAGMAAQQAMQATTVSLMAMGMPPGRKRRAGMHMPHALAGNKRIAMSTKGIYAHPAVRKTWYRLLGAQEQLKSLEQEMSAVRHAAEMQQRQHQSERMMLIDENSKLDAQVSTLVERAEMFLRLQDTGKMLPPADLYEQRFQLLDEHPDDFSQLAQSIEFATHAKNAELARINLAKAKMEVDAIQQESFDRMQRVQMAMRAAEMERSRRIEMAGGDYGPRRLNERVKSLRLNDVKMPINNR